MLQGGRLGCPFSESHCLQSKVALTLEGYCSTDRYKKNEVFLDVVESVNLLVNSNGTVVRSEVMGALKMRTFLSGMPECKLGLNDKVNMEMSISVV
jgi:AP-1 complex subunit mu